VSDYNRENMLGLLTYPLVCVPNQGIDASFRVLNGVFKAESAGPFMTHLMTYVKDFLDCSHTNLYANFKRKVSAGVGTE
jgi:hypothetical protein